MFIFKLSPLVLSNQVNVDSKSNIVIRLLSDSDSNDEIRFLLTTDYDNELKLVQFGFKWLINVEICQLISKID